VFLLKRHKHNAPVFHFPVDGSITYNRKNIQIMDVEIHITWSLFTGLKNHN